MPAAWAKPGMTTALNGIATPFGALTLTLNVSDDGKEATLNVKPLSDASCSRIVVHLNQWTGEATDKVLEIDPAKENNLAISLHGNPA